MLYIKSFENYEEFKQVFAITKHGNGVKSRKNKILLAMLKDRHFFHWWLQTRAHIEKYGSWEKENLDKVDYLNATTMDGLKTFVRFMLYEMTYSYYHIDKDSLWCGNKFDFDGIGYCMYSRDLMSDSMNGICTDGDTRAIHYINTKRNNRVFKMKAGKFITLCIEEHPCTAILPEQVKRWIGEEFAREWQSYAETKNCSKFELHVNNEFDAIYDSGLCLGNFHSCMEGKDFWTFYRDAVDASAAYLTNDEGDIVARCIIYNDVHDTEGNVYRLAERQYSTDCDNILKQILVNRLIAGGHIDGYKCIGADCSDSHNFVLNDGTSLSDKTLYIDCILHSGDTYSYQDSFKYHNEIEEKAYNDSAVPYDSDLTDTDGQYHNPNDNWSDYNECWISYNNSIYDELYEDYIYTSQQCEFIYNGYRNTTNKERVCCDDDYRWSEYEDAYIYHNECELVDGDYRLLEDLVQDIEGDWYLPEDCVWSEYEGEYLLDDPNIVVWSECKDSYLVKGDSIYCGFDDDWCPDDEVCYSELTDDYYVSEESMLAAEQEYRKQHTLVPVNVA